MRILAITGSPRAAKSQSSQLAQAALRGAAEAGATVEQVDLCKLRIDYCIACQFCYREGHCVHTDDFKSVYDKLLAADGIVLASPNYFRSVTAQMKTFLDRMSDAIHCQLLTGKYTCTVASAGGPAGEQVTAYLNDICSSFGAWVTGSATVSASGGPAAMQASEQQAVALGRDLAEAIRTQRRYADQAVKLAQIREYFRRLVERNKENWAHEAAVWSRLGWV